MADDKGEEAHGRQEVHAHVPLQLYVPLVRILEACKALKRESRSFFFVGRADEASAAGANGPPGRATQQRFRWLFLGGGHRAFRLTAAHRTKRGRR